MASAGYYQNPQQQEPGAPPQAYYGAGQQQHQQNPYPQAGYGGMQQNSYPQPQYQPPPPQDQQVNYGQKPGEAGGEAFAPAKPKWNDIIFAILFYAQFFAFIALSVICLRTVANAGGDLSGDASNGLTLNLNTAYLLALIAAAGFVIGLAGLWLTRTFTKAMLEIALLLSVVSTVGYAIYLWIVKFWSGAIIFTILGIFAIIAYFPMRKRIPFSRLILLFCMRIASQYKSIYVTAILSSFIQAAYSVWWAFTVVAVYQKYSPESASGCQTSGGSCGSASVIIAIIFSVFSFYWTTQVISNVSLTTLAGVYSGAYFNSSSEKIAHATRGAFRRAMTYSFGSICFGSLIVALLDLLRAGLRILQAQASDSGDTVMAIVACCVQCCVACVRGLVDYFNRYAYIEIAMFGKSYLNAAKDAWNLLKQRGIDALVNDCLVNNIWTFLSLAAGALCTLFAFVYLHVVKPSYIQANSNLQSVAMLYAFLIGFQICHSLGYVALSSGVSTIFVALGEAPQALQEKDPQLFEFIRQTYPQVVTPV